MLYVSFYFFPLLQYIQDSVSSNGVKVNKGNGKKGIIKKNK